VERLHPAREWPPLVVHHFPVSGQTLAVVVGFAGRFGPGPAVTLRASPPDGAGPGAGAGVAAAAPL